MYIYTDAWLYAHVLQPGKADSRAPSKVCAPEDRQVDFRN